MKLVANCNAKCSCSLDTYDPICGIDKILYYSPCHAGCTSSHQMLVNESKSLTVNIFSPAICKFVCFFFNLQHFYQVYSNCSCIDTSEVKRTKVIGGQHIQIMAVREPCTSSQCTYQLYLFTTLFFAFLALVFLNSMPILSATLRYNRLAK